MQGINQPRIPSFVNDLPQSVHRIVLEFLSPSDACNVDLLAVASTCHALRAVCLTCPASSVVRVFGANFQLHSHGYASTFWASLCRFLQSRPRLHRLELVECAGVDVEFLRSFICLSPPSLMQIGVTTSAGPRVLKRSELHFEMILEAAAEREEITRLCRAYCRSVMRDVTKTLSVEEYVYPRKYWSRETVALRKENRKKTTTAAQRSDGAAAGGSDGGSSSRSTSETDEEARMAPFRPEPFVRLDVTMEIPANADLAPLIATDSDDDEDGRDGDGESAGTTNEGIEEAPATNGGKPNRPVVSEVTFSGDSDFSDNTACSDSVSSDTNNIDGPSGEIASNFLRHRRAVFRRQSHHHHMTHIAGDGARSPSLSVVHQETHDRHSPHSVSIGGRGGGGGGSGGGGGGSNDGRSPSSSRETTPERLDGRPLRTPTPTLPALRPARRGGRRMAWGTPPHASALGRYSYAAPELYVADIRSMLATAEEALHGGVTDEPVAAGLAGGFLSRPAMGNRVAQVDFGAEMRQMLNLINAPLLPTVVQCKYCGWKHTSIDAVVSSHRLHSGTCPRFHERTFLMSSTGSDSVHSAMNQPQRVATVQPPAAGLRPSNQKAQGTTKATSQPAQAVSARADNDGKRELDESTAKNERTPVSASTQESPDVGLKSSPCGKGKHVNPLASASTGGAGRDATPSTPSPAKPGDDSDSHASDELSLVEVYEERGRVLQCRITNLVNQEKQLLPTQSSGVEGLFRAVPAYYAQPPSYSKYLRRATRRLRYARAVCNTFNMILRQKRALYDLSMEMYGPGVDRLWYECGSKLRSRTMEKYYRGWTVYQEALRIADRMESQLSVVRKLRRLSDGAWECIASLICPIPEESLGGADGAGSGPSGQNFWKSYRYGSVGALLDSELMQRSMDGLLDTVESHIQHWMELD